ELDAIIISHAHVDHSGLVPLLFKYGYRGPVYSTMPTRDISALLQLDMVKIQRGEAKEPLYTSEDVKEVVKHTITLDYGEVTDVTPDVRLTLYNAGHILGSAMIHLHVGNGLHNFLYSGDVKFAKTNLLSPSHTNFPRLETLMLESTYGGKEGVMPNPREQDKIFGKMITDTLSRGGKVLIPVLGSGRAQEIIVLIERMIREGTIDTIPIFIDGMVWDITAIHTAYPEYLNNTVREQIFHKDNNPFIQDNIKKVGSAKERTQLIEETGPCVILATSGMLVGGPSVEYLKQIGDNKKNSLIFTCYQGEGSLGRMVQQGLKDINFKNGSKSEMVQLKLEVHKLEITGHSDRRELLSFVNRCNPRPKKIIINHGESSSCLDMARTIHKTNRIETIAPRNLEVIRLR
ncbi:beta-CASP ribonuclease aCPSF1, partial [archaeon]|nr:beta-CASP ribonuclease aCPSF1 [archaeon]